MCMGMFLSLPRIAELFRRLPHVYGDVSELEADLLDDLEFTPCVWGCFRLDGGIALLKEVYPMCMGMFRSDDDDESVRIGLPHVYGDVSNTQKTYSP